LTSPEMGEDGLNLALEMDFDFIVLDLMLPGG
jgi:DNA-binding response OmpR family regulator